MNIVLTALIALVMIVGGAAHLATPDQFVPLVPGFLPASAIIAATGLLQIAVGVMTLWPRTRARGGLAFAAVCLGYLPIHLWDYVRPDPVFAPPVAATVRTLVQLAFIAAGWALFRRTRIEQV
ncbi:MAG: hypothetical protein MUF64_13965 [Polyangiaceae bacterium]|jgi:uncharacterized membrane protein|nr:hypothetical protein [Polyangiaceae bacterium]